MLVGIDPDMERQVTFLDRAVKSGHYLQQGHDRDIVMVKSSPSCCTCDWVNGSSLRAQDLDGNLTVEGIHSGGMFYTGGHDSTRPSHTSR